MSLLLLLRTPTAVTPPPPPVAAPATTMPSPLLRVGFQSSPRQPSGALTDVSSYLRSFSTSRGRSFEFDRMETGTAQMLLSNRDSAWNPENTQGPFYPLKPTRRMTLSAIWDGVEYPLFTGFTEGYPQEFPSAGMDATVQLQASDPFYPLSRMKFPTGTRFARELSGIRIANCLTVAGINAADTDLDAGQSLIAATDPDSQAEGAVLEHILLVAEAENGRFFAARDGKLTFLDRDTRRRQLVSRGTFGSTSGYSYAPAPSLQHDESKLYNLVRITTANGTKVEARDQTSIDEEWERTFEKDWPLAEDNEAQAAANYMLGTLGIMRLRVPELELRPLRNPALMWPLVLALEFGERWTFEFTPLGGGDAIERDVIIDGISHDVTPSNWIVKLRLTLADERAYWRLGVPGASELGSTTRLGY